MLRAGTSEKLLRLMDSTSCTIFFGLKIPYTIFSGYEYIPRRPLHVVFFLKQFPLHQLFNIHLNQCISLKSKVSLSYVWLL